MTQCKKGGKTKSIPVSLNRHAGPSKGVARWRDLRRDDITHRTSLIDLFRVFIE
jgi:hypothetical protein